MTKRQKHEDEVVEDQSHLFGKVIITETRRPDGTLKVSEDYSYCPSMAEQHNAHLTDINWLISKYRPDELAAYIAAKNASRVEIKGHDFSKEPDLQTGMNETYRLRQAFKNLPDDIKVQFQNHVEFLKFIDNPLNQQKMVKMGLLTKKQIAEVATEVPTTTKEEEKPKSP